MPCIYKITNIKTGKSYVGQTNKTPEERFKRHCAEARWATFRRQPIVEAIHDEGPEAFKITLIEEFKPKTRKHTVYNRETYWGLELNTLHPKGYNLRLGKGPNTVARLTRNRHNTHTRNHR